MVTEQNPPEFTDVYLSASTLWRRRWWIVAGVVLGAILAGAFVFTQPDTNRSWAQVLIRPLGVDLTRGSANANNAIDPITERELARSLLVAERTSERIDGRVGPRTLRQEVDITVVERSPVIEFSWADQDATLARDVAQAYADSYLSVREQLATETLTETEGILLDRRAEVDVAFAAASDRVAAAAEDEAELRSAINEQTVLGNQITQLNNDIANLRALTTDGGVVISEAQLAQQSERPRAIPITLAGAVLGAMLGLLAALFVDRNQRDRDLGESQLDRLGLPAVAHIPHLSAGSDAYATLENQVLASQKAGNQVLAVATMRPEGHPAQIAPSLGLNLAQSGHNVLLISADFERHSVSRQLGLDPGPGLLDALVTGRSPGEMVQHSGRLAVISAGQSAADAAGLLRMVGLRRLLDEARPIYDIIILSAPDLVDSEAALLTAWAADAIALVIESGDRRSEVEQATELIRRTDRALLGSIVLTDTSV